MTNSDEVKRDYNKPDDKVIEQGDLMNAAFDERRDAFVKKYPDLDGPFNTDWRNDIEVARSFTSDADNVSLTALATQQLTTEMTNGRNILQDVFIYVEHAFPGNAAMLNLFGKKDYLKMRNSQTLLPQLLDRAFTSYKNPDYKPLLVNKGLTETEAAKINTSAQAIIRLNKKQELLKKARGLSKRDRIIVLNRIWAKMSYVSECAKSIYRDDAETRKLFNLYKAGEEKPKPPETGTQP
ncbi:MAG: hypothetical protein M0R21_05010 [Lentimicrobiaceae bacterium]|nr:hypothetical protein [Lentimicrobiaceae bacterium]